MHEVRNYEGALKLAQQIEKDDDGQLTILTTHKKLGAKRDHLQNITMQLELQETHLWCTNFHMEGYM